MRSRRGVAMLLVLMTMTVLMVAVTIIAGTRTSSALSELQALDAIQANDLLRASQEPILHWLRSEANQAVVDPSLSAPMAPVLDQAAGSASRKARIRITAWDQQGMWPSNAQELGLEPPRDVPWHESQNPGIDHVDRDQRIAPSVEYPDALGGLIATHNPWPTRAGSVRSRSGTSINANTAPQALLQAVYAQYNLGDPSQLLASRAQGEWSAVTVSAQDARQRDIRVVSVSRVWAFRIDVWVGTIQRSCWCIYANQGGNWRLVQRFVLHNA